MSIKIEKPFDITQLKFEKNFRIKTPLSSTISGYNAYMKGIEINARKLKQKYPFKSEFEIHSLLEELQNDIQTAAIVIEAEKAQEKPRQIQKKAQIFQQVYSQQDEKLIASKKEMIVNIHDKLKLSIKQKQVKSEITEKNKKELQKLAVDNWMLNRDEEGAEEEQEVEE